MAVITEPRTDRGREDYSVSYKTIAGLLIAFLLGMSGHALLRNALGATTQTFTTIELVNFVLSVVLSGASIFLAVAAISLGKVSERVMIERSDESIRLQNEVFQKTTDALQRIESSTGVTEKRIEDIISGRAGDISQKIAKIASEKGEGEGQANPEELASIIRKSLIESMKEEGVLPRSRASSADLSTYEERRKKREEEEQKKAKRYHEIHFRALRAFSEKDDIKTIKLHHGNTGATGEDLFDALFMRRDGSKIAVTTFREDIPVEAVRVFTTSALNEIQAKYVSDVYIVVFEESEKYRRAYQRIIDVASSELREHVRLIVCPPDSIESVIKEIDIANQAL